MTEPREVIAEWFCEVDSKANIMPEHWDSADGLLDWLTEHGYQTTKAQAGMPRLVASDAIPEDEVWFMRGRKVVGKITGLTPTPEDHDDHQ